MLTQLYLKRFKCFDELALPLAPLTFLTGFNASGKSTALQTLLLLAQAQRANIREPLFPLNGSLAHLGTPGEVLNEHADEKELVLGVESDKARIHWTLQSEERAGNPWMRVTNIGLKTEAGSETFAQPVKLDRLLPSGVGDTAVKEIIDTLQEIVYLSAVRRGTADVFPSPEETEPVHANVGTEGELAAWWFDRCSDDEVQKQRCHPSDQARTLRRQLNAWAGELFQDAQANVQRIPKTNLVRLELRNSETSEWRRPSNIGYGLTYAFPILVGGLIAKSGQVLVVDSPEAHLHPRGQSQIGRFLSQIASAGVQVIIETHSDHVLNGVRLAVRDRTIGSDAVAVHFFSREAARSRVQVISPAIDQNGNLSEWPRGFFDQSEHDLAQLAGWK